jgi:hypothetical protein
MGGGLIQLVAYGIQDIYIVGDPQITFFKTVYRRHTNFATESVKQYFTDPFPNFGKKVTCNISHSGDLINQIYVYIELPPVAQFINSQTKTLDPNKKFAWARNIGYTLIKEVTIEINQKIIDRHFGEWLYIWSQLANSHKRNYDKLIGDVEELYTFSNGKNGYRIYVPLQFWFCRNTGLSLPVIALRNSSIQISITFRNLEECYALGPTNSMQVLDDVVPFQPYEYIYQTVNGQTINGLFINHDYLNKKINYIQIRNGNNPQKSFVSLTESGTPLSILNNMNYINNVPYRIYSVETTSYCTPLPNSIENVEDVTLQQTLSLPRSYLYVDYVFLDNDERVKFARANHEYLIEQLQYNELRSIKSPNVKTNLTLNHPSKAVYWVCQLDSLVGKNSVNDLYNFTTSINITRKPIIIDPVKVQYTQNPDGVMELTSFFGNPSTSSTGPYGPSTNSFVIPEVNITVPPGGNVRSPASQNKYNIGNDLTNVGTLQLNGYDRFGIRDNKYFNNVQPFQHYTKAPIQGINVYSLSVYPEKNQPSGACNMSKIDQVSFQLTLDNIISTQNSAYLRIYTINYNVFRVYYGLGAVAFV